jgi:hypothetical protein
MQINVDEARIVLGAIKASNFEQGDDDDPTSDDNKLVARIRQEFPEIAEEIRVTERKRVIWSDICERDERVIQARNKLESSDIRDPGYDKIQREFFWIKGIVDKEIRTKEGL